MAAAAAAGALAVVEVDPFSTMEVVEQPGDSGGAKRTRKRRSFHRKTRKI